MPTFNENTNLVAYVDSNRSIPQQYVWNYTKSICNLPINNPSEASFSVAGGTSTTLFNNSVATGIDNTTIFNLTANPILPNTYRFTSTGGTSPAFRVTRGLTLSGSVASFVINSNGTAVFSINTGSLAALQAGDTLFLPGISTGDTAGPFNTSNEGAWTVTSGGSLSVTLARPGGFSGYTQSGVAITANSQVLGFGPVGVQIGNSVDILGGFNAYTIGTYIVSQVTPLWVEVGSNISLPTQTGITPTAPNMKFYSALKRWVRIETNCLVYAQYNGDTSTNYRLNPIFIQDSTLFAFDEKMGSAFSLTIQNPTAQPASIRVFSFE